MADPTDQQQGNDEQSQGLTQQSQQKASSQQQITYSAERVIGNGSFGVVYQAKILETGERVAIKKVLINNNFKNREYQILSELNHPCVVKLRQCFFSQQSPTDSQTYLNLVMDLVPETIHRTIRNHSKARRRVPLRLVQRYCFQLLRSVAYIHRRGICHRDIKPQNVLIDSNLSVLKLCDFGSAKKLTLDESNVGYICSRYYRAPELVLDASYYTTAVDLWSVGCVFGELLNGRPLFTGNSSRDQFIKIVEILGAPSREQLVAMRCNDSPVVAGENNHPLQQQQQQQQRNGPPRLNNLNTYHPHLHNSTTQGPRNLHDNSDHQAVYQRFRALLPPDTPSLAIDLLLSLLQYRPQNRLDAFSALCHPFFNGIKYPKNITHDDLLLFSYTDEELDFMFEKGLTPLLLPTWVRQNMTSEGLFRACQGIYTNEKQLLYEMELGYVLPLQSTSNLSYTDLSSPILANCNELALNPASQQQQQQQQQQQHQQTTSPSLSQHHIQPASPSASMSSQQQQQIPKFLSADPPHYTNFYLPQIEKQDLPSFLASVPGSSVDLPTTNPYGYIGVYNYHRNDNVYINIANRCNNDYYFYKYPHQQQLHANTTAIMNAESISKFVTPLQVARYKILQPNLPNISPGLLNQIQTYYTNQDDFPQFKNGSLAAYSPTSSEQQSMQRFAAQYGPLASPLPPYTMKLFYPEAYVPDDISTPGQGTASHGGNTQPAQGTKPATSPSSGSSITSPPQHIFNALNGQKYIQQQVYGPIIINPSSGNGITSLGEPTISPIEFEGPISESVQNFHQTLSYYYSTFKLNLKPNIKYTLFNHFTDDLNSVHGYFSQQMLSPAYAYQQQQQHQQQQAQQSQLQPQPGGPQVPSHHNSITSHTAVSKHTLSSSQSPSADPQHSGVGPLTAADGSKSANTTAVREGASANGNQTSTSMGLTQRNAGGMSFE